MLPNAQISTLEQRLEHALHWKGERDTLETMVQQLGASNLGAEAMRQYQRVHDFARHVAEMLTLVNDRLVPRDFEHMRDNGFTELVSLMTMK